jgi:hypothetical protein
MRATLARPIPLDAPVISADFLLLELIIPSPPENHSVLPSKVPPDTIFDSELFIVTSPE